jgi:hypothetical protein
MPKSRIIQFLHIAGADMAIVAGIKIKTKAPRATRMAFADEKYTGPEPLWDSAAAEAMDQTEFDHHLRKSFYYYNYHYNQKDTKKYIVEWMQNNGYPKQQVSDFIRSPDRLLSMTACSIVMAHRAGMPMRDRQMQFMREQIAEVLAQSEPETVETVTADRPKAYVPTIQDRLNERTSELIGELEGVFDDVSQGIANSTKLYDFLVANNVVQGQLSKYEALYSKRREELQAAQGREDLQLREGYSNFKAADFKRMISWIDNLLAAVEQYRGVKKATKKARVKKAPSKEKLVAKLKYAKTDAALKIVSINPADIIGAAELWIYNIKTRKLGKYVAAGYQTLGIKGTSITGFDTDKSVAKTLRKPEEKLKEFAKSGKVQLRKFLDDVRATETKLNGRIGTDTVLLKVQ